ncbi:MAG: 50S ribosomal protein L4 [Verrucomicrobia bacterium GWF2_51_19]|nr:MAG: 50S ribosomal protein L4 [Verrucomicrobia bacterium GWF2_51_19]HCJ12572.1 50S ribosomal protein L4 [Opitutae bacterium]
MKLKIFTSDAKQSQEKEVRIPVYTDDKGVQALRDVILAYQSNLRQGNACTKDRGDVKGSGVKPWRQKGTGRARHGEKRSPLWRGGGIVFGPKPRDYTQKMNRKVKTLALRRALFECCQANELALIEKFAISEGKTRLFNDILGRLADKGKVLLVDQQFDDTVVLAGRNIERLYMIDADSLNPWDLIRYDAIIMSENALERVLTRAQL